MTSVTEVSGSDGIALEHVAEFEIARMPADASNVVDIQFFLYLGAAAIYLVGSRWLKDMPLWATLGLLAFLMAIIAMMGFNIVAMVRQLMAAPAALRLSPNTIDILDNQRRLVYSRDLRELEAVQRGPFPRDSLRLVFRSGRPLRLRGKAFKTSSSAEDFLAEVTRRADLVMDPYGQASARSLSTSARLSRPLVVPSLSIYGSVLLALIYSFQARISGTNPLTDPIIIAHASHGAALVGGDYMRLVSASLLHGSPYHLVLNMIGLIVFGTLVESLAGRRLLIIVAGSASIAGYMLSSVMAPRAYAVGASGAITGCLGFLCFVYALRRAEIPFALRLPRSKCLALLASTALAESLPRNADHFAHAGGLAVGFGLAALLLRRRSLSDWMGGTSQPVAVAAIAIGTLYLTSVAGVLVDCVSNLK